MPNKPGGLTTIIGNLAQDSFKWLLIFLLSTGLVGGASYLLFDAPAKLNTINRAKIEIQFNQDEGRSALDMMSKSNDGWFKDASNAGLLYDADAALQKAGPRGELSAEFRDDLIARADKALAQLSVERGYISGYIFVGDYYKAQQSALLKTYDEAIHYLMLEKNTAQDWLTDSADKRSANLRAISAAKWKFLESVATQSSVVGQSGQVEKSVQALNQAIDENATESIALIIRSCLSFVGVVWGVLIILMLVAPLVRSQKQPPSSGEKEKPDAAPNSPGR